MIMNTTNTPPADFRPDAGYFLNPGPAFGDGTVCIDVLGLQAELSGLDDELETLIRRRYKAFLADAPSQAAARIRVCRSEAPGFLEWRPGQDVTHRLETEWDGNLRIHSYGFSAKWDPVGRTGVLCLAPEPENRRELSFENFLRVVYSWLALDSGGFLFHSSALVPEDGKAYLFFGPSGAGKTTCCILSEGIARPINDDLVLLHWSESSGGWRAAAVPFTGKYGREEAGNSYPVAAMFRLVQSVDTRTEPLSTAAAVVEVLSSCPFMEERPPDTALADRVAEIVRAVPVRRLHFRKDPSFWEVVQADLPSQEEMS